MNWIDWISNLSWQDIQQLLHQYEALGPLPGVVAPMLEAFIPILPLAAILVANVNAYGLLEGILLSWIGVFLGAISVFLIVRRYGQRFRTYIDRKFPRGRKFIVWLEEHGFSTIFLLSCFPFTPSFFVNVISGISKLPFRTYLIATLLGKGIMISFVSYAGHDVEHLLRQPWKIVIIVAFFLILWLIGRKLENRFFH